MEFNDIFNLNPILKSGYAKSDTKKILDVCCEKEGFDYQFIYDKYKAYVDNIKYKNSLRSDPKYHNKIISLYQWLEEDNWEAVVESENIQTPVDEYLYGKNKAIFS